VKFDFHSGGARHLARQLNYAACAFRVEGECSRKTWSCADAATFATIEIDFLSVVLILFSVSERGSGKFVIDFGAVREYTAKSTRQERGEEEEEKREREASESGAPRTSQYTTYYSGFGAQSVCLLCV
jgi:hypothetical protein